MNCRAWMMGTFIITDIFKEINTTYSAHNFLEIPHVVSSS